MIWPMFKEIAAEYRIGDRDVENGLIDDILVILRRFQASTFDSVMGFDTREYKQENEELLNQVRRLISQSISDVQYTHNNQSAGSILRTIKQIVQRVTGISIADGWTELEAQRALTNYFRGQTIRIGMTEGQWAVETARSYTVLEVNDPLRNSIRQIADLFRNDQAGEARKLAKQVENLARLPLSESQGNVVSYVYRSQAELVGPEAQARALNTMERLGSELDSPEKEWSAVFVRTRDAHADADEQRQPISEPFNVGGEMLMYPGDGSLGASLWNIVNCQCAAEFL